VGASIHSAAMTPPVLRLALCALLCLLLAPAAGAAERQVPERFVGVMWDQEIQDAPLDVQTQQWALMATSGVETARVIFSWELAQPRETRPIRFKKTDVMVEQAARHGIELLPVIHYAPKWARLVKERASAPKNVADYVRYAVALVERYGPEGTFWTERPDVPKLPVRTWQVWNEPQLHWQFQPHAGWHKRYGEILRRTNQAIKRADPGAKVLLAGLANRAWDAIATLYRHGKVGGHFDVAGLHMYSKRSNDFLEILRRFRRTIDRFDRGRPIWITEIGASASLKAVRAHPSVRHLQTTHRKMADLIPVTYRNLARGATSSGVERVYWYTWASPYTVASYVFGWSGLNAFTSDYKVAPMYALESYREVARELEGCAKDEQARCVE
jgi:hypothetical protein